MIGLAGHCVVGEQEAERVLPEHALVDRDALVRQRVDDAREETLRGNNRVVARMLRGSRGSAMVAITTISVGNRQGNVVAYVQGG